eukprot:g6539.t1
MATLCVLALTTCCAAALDSVIDTHVHNADISRIPYTFPAAFPDLNKSWSIDDFALAARSAGVRVRGALLMELEKQNNTFAVGLEEARMFQATANRCNRQPLPTGCVPIAGFVASAPLQSEPTALRRYLAQLRRCCPSLRGVRQPLWKQNASFFVGASGAPFRAGLRELGALGLPFDLLVRREQLPDITALAAAVPEVRFNLNHLGYPNTSSTLSADFRAWAAHIDALAALPNVYCKLSGLPQTFGGTGWRAQDFAPFVSHALGAFGARRVNFAGNWFVLMEQKWGGSYPAMAAALQHTLDLLNVSAADRRQIFSETAARLYNL